MQWGGGGGEREFLLTEWLIRGYTGTFFKRRYLKEVKNGK